LPQPPQADAQPADVPEDEAGGEPPPPPPGDDAASEPPASAEGPLEDRVLEAARAAIPAGLLAQLQAAVAAGLSRRPPPGKAGEARANRTRGRIAGTRRHVPGDGGRVAVVDTLRNAAPWQPLRRREADLAGRSLPSGRRVEVRSDDLRAHRYRQHLQTVTLFAVDASGSSALHRLAEAKGAVELLLADCYVRRDEVALVAFRGHAAELLLPPTRSLVRVKRSLAGLPGGGGTPLAAGIETAATLARAVLARGQQPSLVFLTDGRANVARDGTPGRERGEADALAAVRGLRALGVACLVIDTSPRPGPASRHLAEAMGARYLALPHADAATVARAVQAAAPDARVAA
jgi:magnesium chelatase subunit D